MSEAKHTPGPWSVDCVGGIYVQGHIGEFVAECKSEGGKTEAKANAELIAKAPDMALELERLKAVNAELLEALKHCLSYRFKPTSAESIRKIAGKAIAKAEAK